MNLRPFKDTYGMPPSTHISDEMIVNSMPVAEIIPCRPDFSRGLTLFNINPDWETYERILTKLGYETLRPIKVAFLADNFPTDSFTNEYGETFLQKFTDVASQGISQLNQMTGSDTATQGLEKLGVITKALGADVKGPLGAILTGGGQLAASGAQAIKNLVAGLNAAGTSQAGRFVGSGLNTINKLLAGHRVDFPQVWTNSGYAPSYSMTVRLYNPHPGNTSSTEQYIVGPLAVLLALAIPRSDNGRTYNWPFFHKVNGPGIYNLDPAVITNITVVKGGDQQQIAYNQVLSMVDVRIDFTSLYSSMLVEDKGSNVTNRPTLRNYLNALKNGSGKDVVYSRNQINQSSAVNAGLGNSIAQQELGDTLAQQLLTDKTKSSRQGLTISITGGSRSPTNSLQDTLEAETPSGVLPS